MEATTFDILLYSGSTMPDEEPEVYHATIHDNKGGPFERHRILITAKKGEPPVKKIVQVTADKYTGEDFDIRVSPAKEHRDEVILECRAKGKDGTAARYHLNVLYEA